MPVASMSPYELTAEYMLSTLKPGLPIIVCQSVAPQLAAHSFNIVSNINATIWVTNLILEIYNFLD